MSEKFYSRIVPVIVVLLMLIIAGCAGRSVGYTVSAGEGEKPVALEVNSFRFEPNAIEAHTGDRLLLQIHNAAGMEHNLTVANPGGKIMLAIDVPAGKTVEGRVSLEQPGAYRFYCDKPLHTSMGMSGTITAR